MKHFLYALIVFLPTLLLSQPKFGDFEVELGPFFKVAKRSVPVEFIGSDASGFYIIYARGKTGSGERSLAKFGYNLQLKQELELSQMLEGGRAYSGTTFMVDQKLFHFLSVTNVDEENIYLQEIDKQAMSFKEAKRIATISDAKSAYYSDSFVSFSLDSSYMAFIYTVPNRKKDKEKIGIHVFNRNMEEQWNKKFELPYTNKLLDLKTYRVNNDGKVHVLGKRFYNKRKEERNNEVNYDYLLFSLDRTGVIDSFKMETEGKYFRDMQVDFSKDGDIVSAGFYSDQNSVNAGGAYYLRMNAETKKVITSSFKEFETDFITQNMKAGKAKKLEKKIQKGKDIELPYFHIDEFLVGDDGSTQIVAERRLIYTTTTATQNGIITNTHYDYDDIMVLDIDSQGTIRWASRVAKNQHTVNDGAVYSSYAAAKKENNLFLLFNDNVQNLNYSGVGRVAPMSKGSATMVMVNRLDDEGNSKRSALFDRSEVGTKIRPALSKQVSFDEMLLFGHKGLKTQRFILLKLK